MKHGEAGLCYTLRGVGLMLSEALERVIRKIVPEALAAEAVQPNLANVWVLVS